MKPGGDPILSPNLIQYQGRNQKGLGKVNKKNHLKKVNDIMAGSG